MSNNAAFLTGKCVLKQKWYGLIVMVECEVDVLNGGSGKVGVKKFWRKATSEDLPYLNLKTINSS